MKAQEQVGQFLKERGYTSKSPAAHLTKAMVKMLEEACEAAKLAPLPVELSYLVNLLEKTAKKEFDRMVAEGDRFDPPVDTWLLDDMGYELADVCITVMDVANALSRLDGEPFDVVAAAVEKAGADIERGVRQ